MAFAAFLIDLDGTLANSEPLKGLALADTCLAYGASVSSEIYVDVMGEDWPTVTSHFFRCADIHPDYDEFNEQFRLRYLGLLEASVELTPGASKFIEASKSQGIRLAVVSSAAAWMAEKVLTKLGVKHAFDLVIAREHVKAHKPHPEAYLLALARLGLAPEDVLVFEDSHAGLRAAHGAGCKCVAVKHRFNVNHDLSSAIRTIHSFSELLEESLLSTSFILSAEKLKCSRKE